MQNCFREHPDIYGGQLEDEDDEVASPAPSEQPTAADIDTASHPEEKQARAKEVNTQVKAAESEKGESAESESLVPKAAHDAEEKNEK